MLPILRLLLCLVLIVGAAPVAGSQTLRVIQERLVEKYPRVDVIAPDELAREIIQADDLLILDVRSEEEFRVSHIPGALRVDPGAPARTISALIERQGNPGIVVLYCSVGYRSTRMANRVRKVLPPDTAVDLYNLSGGLFLWHNQNRLLEDDLGPTEYIHPYDAAHAPLLVRKSLVSTKPSGHADP